MEFIQQNIIVIISLVLYGIVYIVHRAQFKKQNEILAKYEKIFSIVNVDEIEKYVQLQKRNSELEYIIKVKEVSNLEANAKELEKKAGDLVVKIKDGIGRVESATNQTDKRLSFASDAIATADQISKSLNHTLTKNRVLVPELLKTSANESAEYIQLFAEIKQRNPKEATVIDAKISKISNKYEEAKISLLKDLED